MRQCIGDPNEPLTNRLERVRSALLKEHKEPAVDANVVKRINGLDDELDAQFLHG